MKKVFIETPEQLTEFCQHIESSPWLAIDTEFIREKSYYAKLCLIQVANDHIAACIDPLILQDLSPLFTILYNTNTLKIFHSCHQDLEIFCDMNNAVPSPVFDTQIAGALVGMSNQESYAAFVKKFLGITLDKSQTRTDWEHRPLTQKQLDYAYADVTHLGKVYQILLDKLQSTHRLGWLKDDFLALEKVDHYQKQPETLWQKVKGYKHLKGVQLSVLKSLTSWRETQAQSKNIPRRWVLSDEVLLDTARHMPSALKNLSRIRGFNKKSIEKEGKTILNLISTAQQTPREDWPIVNNNYTKLTPNQEALVDVLMAVVRLKATENNVSVASLAKRKELELVAVGEQPKEFLSGWKKSILGDDLFATINGESTISIQNGQLKIKTKS